VQTWLLISRDELPRFRDSTPPLEPKVVVAVVAVVAVVVVVSSQILYIVYLTIQSTDLFGQKCLIVLLWSQMPNCTFSVGLKHLFRLSLSISLSFFLSLSYFLSVSLSFSLRDLIFFSRRYIDSHIYGLNTSLILTDPNDCYNNVFKGSSLCGLI